MAKNEDGKQIGRLLPNRRNIILTQDHSFKKEGAEVTYSVDETINLLEKTSKKEEENFVIGGGQIYKLFIDKADKLYITHVDGEFPDAEIFFPVIDKTKWKKIKSETLKKDALNKYDLEFALYVKKN